jgi:cytolysin (calcineurin-like family phosphatase)
LAESLGFPGNAEEIHKPAEKIRKKEGEGVRHIQCKSERTQIIDFRGNEGWRVSRTCMCGHEASRVGSSSSGSKSGLSLGGRVRNIFVQICEEGD